MQRFDRSKDAFVDQAAAMRALRDQIRLDLHLASMDLRDEWAKLEKQLPEFDQVMEPLTAATHDAVEALVDELRHFGAKLRTELEAPAPRVRS